MYESNDLSGWTFHPYTTPDGAADVWVHWPGNTWDTDARIYASAYDWGYVMEGLMPAATWSSSENGSGGINMAAGVTFSNFIVFLQAPEEGVHHGFTDAGWFGGPDGSHSYTLSAAVAPGAPAEPEPAVAEPDPGPIVLYHFDPVAREAELYRGSAPETSDGTGIILVLAAAALAFKTAKKAR